MSIKSKTGPLIITLLSFIPLIIWLFVRRGSYGFDTFKNASYSLGQISALIGTAMFALTFLLTTRLKIIEESFSGLDKMYKFHHLLGAASFVLLLLHPILLITKYIPENMKTAALFLLPGGQWPYTAGIIALWLMIILLVLTFFINIKYQNWKLSHKFMGLVFLIALTHFFFVDTDIKHYPILRYYMIFVSAIGVISYIYSLFLRPFSKNKFNYILERSENLNNVSILTLKPLNKKIEFKAGQFVFIKLFSTEFSKEQHPFTVASSPSTDGKIRLVIKSLGDYTSLLSKLKPNTRIDLEGPYGKFDFSKYNSEQIWIAGGIGITPFLSFAQQLSKSKSFNNKISLLYCVKNKSEAIFIKELNEYSSSYNKLKIYPYFSDEMGILDINKIKKISNNVDNSHIFICGPPGMMFSLQKQLINAGVPKKNIHFEEFNIK